jgi:hypothetical protein
MAGKCIQKLMLIMIELIVLLIIEVNGNNPTPFSLGPAPFPTGLHVFLLDQSHNHICLEKTVDRCEKYQRIRDVEDCIIRNIFPCLFKNPDHLEFPEHKRYKIMGQCIGYCFEILKSEGINSAACLVDCYEEQINRH